jgi:hypothetical protein
MGRMWKIDSGTKADTRWLVQRMHQEAEKEIDQATAEQYAVDLGYIEQKTMFHSCSSITFCYFDDTHCSIHSHVFDSESE